MTTGIWSLGGVRVRGAIPGTWTALIEAGTLVLLLLFRMLLRTVGADAVLVWLSRPFFFLG
jgi:hypothetical protein